MLFLFPRKVSTHCSGESRWRYFAETITLLTTAAEKWGGFVSLEKVKEDTQLPWKPQGELLRCKHNTDWLLETNPTILATHIFPCVQRCYHRRTAVLFPGPCHPLGLRAGHPREVSVTPRAWPVPPVPGSQPISERVELHYKVSITFVQYKTPTLPNICIMQNRGHVFAFSNMKT